MTTEQVEKKKGPRLVEGIIGFEGFTTIPPAPEEVGEEAQVQEQWEEQRG